MSGQCQHQGKQIAEYHVGSHLLVEYECDLCGAFYTHQFDADTGPTDKPTKPSKHNNTRVQHDGIWFDSIVEGRRYLQLKTLERAGVIRNLEVQKPFIVYAGGTDNEGKPIPNIKYLADFTYFDPAVGKTVIEDVKGHATDVFKMKWKLMRDKFKNDPTVMLVKLPANEV
jgi:hypothetical protein